MTTLMIQTFLLLLTAFFAGATLACLIRRLIYGRGRDVAVVPAQANAGEAAPAAPVAVSTPSEGGQERFAKALTGAGSAAAAAPPSTGYSPVVVGVAAAAAVAARQSAVRAPPANVAPPAQSAASEPAKVVEPAPQRVVFPAAGNTGGSNSVAAEVTVGPTPAAAPLATGGLPAEELTRIRGIDADTRQRLASLGVTRFQQIAEWNASAVKSFSHLLGFQGRIERENWIEQAQILAKGGQTHYSELLDRGGVAVAAPPADQGQPIDLAAAATKAASPSAAVSGLPDQLVRIHGIDGEGERLLNQWGITRFAQIAAWGAPDVERFEALLGRPGRIARENWVVQAQILARGGLGSQAVAASAARESVVETIAEGQRPVRSDVANLRSVRSEALRSEASRFGDYPGVADDLKRIRGIGVLIEKKLNSLGVATYEQVANWTSSDIDRISQVLDFKGRIERENWVEQARILASGGQTEFSRRLERSDA